MNERAKEDVEAFIHILKDQHGIDIMDVQRAVRFHARMDRRAEVIANTAIKIVITALMAGVGYVVYFAVMYLTQLIQVVRI